MEEMTKNMRKFHNWVKLQLISKVNQTNACLFDIGVGRGGDLHKWLLCNIKQVIGVDVSTAYIHEAISRFKTLKRRDVYYKFYNVNPKDDYLAFLRNKNETIRRFNIVSCQFAFHYFAETDESLRRIFKTISDALLPDGYFIGTVPDGKHIDELLVDNYYKNSVMFVKKDQNRIKFSLSGTLYFGDKLISDEFVVYKEKLVEIAEEYNLKLIEWTPFEDLYGKYDDILDGDHKKASFVNSAFIFKKMNH